MSRFLLVCQNDGPTDDRVAGFLSARGACKVTVRTFAPALVQTGVPAS